MIVKPMSEITASTRVTVILPTYNERGNIVALIEAIRSALEGHDLEVLVVDDNSPDGTAELVRETFKDRQSVKLVVRTEDKGFAKSIRRGLEDATGDVLVVMDTDFNHQPKYLPFMVESMKHYDMVMGSRFLYGGLMEPRSRHLLSWVFNVYVRVVTGGQITDNLYGFFAVHRRVMGGVNYDRVFFGYGDYFIRLLYYLQHQKIHILQFPAVNGRRLAGQGNSRFLKVFLKYSWATLGLSFRGRI
ncbi:MAG TPA: glycosyltransferase [Planctomycetota bacterium]